MMNRMLRVLVLALVAGQSVSAQAFDPCPGCLGHHITALDPCRDCIQPALLAVQGDDEDGETGSGT